jgi:pSer/pThr/pTyr-binding forkhead associated (FHA) protein
MAYLVVRKQEQELDRFELSGPVVIGRSPECDVSITDITLSRKHLQIEPEGEVWRLRDLGSRNGTFVNGNRVDEHLLAEGDVIAAGDAQLQFHLGRLAGTATDRPADPHEALQQTRGEPMPQRRVIRPPRTGAAPRPQPRAMPGESQLDMPFDSGSTLMGGMIFPSGPPVSPPPPAPRRLPTAPVIRPPQDQPELEPAQITPAQPVQTRRPVWMWLLIVAIALVFGILLGWMLLD